MKEIRTYIFLIFAIFSFSVVADATPASEPHLWLSTDPNTFDEGGTGYVGKSLDPWLNESYHVSQSPFTMYLYNALQNGNNPDAMDIGLIVVVHDGEAGSVSITDEFGNTTTLTSFTGTDVGPYYGGGNHGVYLPHDGVFAIYHPSQQIDLSSDDPDSEEKKWTSFVIATSSFSQVHFDAFSSNGFYNPASHDVTVSPEPASAFLLAVGLFGMKTLKSKRRKHE